MTAMFVLGLTGSIATGKSTVLGLFAEAGVPVIAADQVVHDLYGAEAAPLIEESFPGATEGGRVSRQKLSAIVLQDPMALARIETIIHPLVRERIARFVDAARARGEPLAVLDIPLLFETGHDYGVNAVLVTLCGEEEQRRRALSRPGMTVEKLETILARQVPQAEKSARADYVIRTDQLMEHVQDEVQRLTEALTQKGSSH